jgi:long-chain acyl-CoA synthetase
MDDAASVHFVKRVSEEVGANLKVPSREHAQGEASPTVLILEDLRSTLSRHSPGRYEPAPVAAGDPLEIIFTSGTTAEPKGVVITHGNVLTNVAPLETEIQKYLKYERWFHPVRFLNLLPLSHVFGQFLGMFLPSIMAGTVIFQESLGPSEVMQTIRRERVSVLVAVPRMLQSLKDKLERDLEGAGRVEAFSTRFRRAEGRPFLRRAWIFRRMHGQFGWKFWAFISGGAALDQDTEEFWSRLGFAVIQGYGLTETTSWWREPSFRLAKDRLEKFGRARSGGGRRDPWSAAAWRVIGRTRITSDDGGARLVRNWRYRRARRRRQSTLQGRKKDVIRRYECLSGGPGGWLRRQPEVKDCVVIALREMAIGALRRDDPATPALIGTGGEARG